MKAMLATSFADGLTSFAMMNSQFWVMEPKYDGIRALAHIDNGRVDWRNRNDEPLTKPVPTRATNILSSLPGQLILDGEVVDGKDGKYVIFDLPYFGGDLTRSHMKNRRAILTEVAGIINSPSIPLARQERIGSTMDIEGRSNGWEGLIYRHELGIYLPGKRSKDLLKLKFTKDIDCVVSEVGRDGKRNAVLALRDGNRFVEIGQCSLLGKVANEDLKIGSVLEVRYLYAHKGRLVQPRMLRERHDKDPLDCTIDQLLEGNHDDVELNPHA
jgi:ATP-dependent DNA ligase